MRLWSFLIIPVFVMLVVGACGGGAGSKVDQTDGDGGPGGPGGQLGDGGGCQPKTCADMGYNCGQNADGCGNLLDCGTCTAPTFCGAGGFSKCGGDEPGDGGICTPKTCADQGFTCGPAGDGCGNMIACGACNAPQFCGGGGFSQCGGNASPEAGVCVPSTCAAQGITCGPAADGCGNLLQCGTCQAPQICGGGSAPGVCGDTIPCTGLCLNQVACGGGVTTTFTGTVVAGTQAPYGTPDPVPNVIVYVPNGPVAAFAPGVQCNQCGADVSGNPLIETTTDYKGNFTLTNVPVPPSGMVPVVIQLGRWRRQLTFPVTQCTTASLGQIHMPRNKTEGDIPFTAISTGEYDALECVLVKMGVDTTEFTIPGGGGRIEMYQGNGVDDGPNTPAETALTATAGPTVFDNYDQVLFPCWGGDPEPGSVDSTFGQSNVKTPTELSNFNAYVNGGGRVFTTHYSYAWLFNNPPFSTVATWAPDIEPLTATANIQQAPAEVNTFYMWMNALTTNGSTGGQFTLNQPRYGLSAINTSESELWIEGTNPQGTETGYTSEGTAPASFPLLFTTNTPVQSANQCGRVIFSGFHVITTEAGFTGTFPSECAQQPMSAQEKALEYLIWDLASCVPGPPAPLCRPLTCAQQNIGCGPAGDGCGNTIQCGPCTAPQTCGGGGQFAQCGGVDAGTCVPQTCAQQNIGCGPAGDGCGGAINCGPCTPPQTCGGGGTPGQCGFIDGGSCTPQTCQELGINCGSSGNGCGGTLSCGTCTAPETCGGGGMPGVCGGGTR